MSGVWVVRKPLYAVNKVAGCDYWVFLRGVSLISKEVPVKNLNRVFFFFLDITDVLKKQF